jgi:hypothetical protein
MNWKGRNATQAAPYKKIVSNNTDWDKLWQTAFSKPAPPVDFENFVVACVFLGENADGVYSINFGQSYAQDGMMFIPYGLVMAQLEIARVDGRDEHRSFGGQYHMKVFAKPKGLEMQLRETKGDGDGAEFFKIPSMKK